MAKSETTTTEPEAKPKRPPRQLVWNTKEIREEGGSLVFVGSLDSGKFQLIGQLQGVGRTLDQNVAEAMGVEESGLAKKLGNKDVIAVTAKTGVYRSSKSDRPS